MAVIRKEDHFMVSKVKQTYYITKTIGPPGYNANPGDLHQDTSSGALWVRYENDWRIVEPPPRIETIAPGQRHPSFNDFRLFGLRWINRRGWYKDNTRTRSTPGGSKVQRSTRPRNKSSTPLLGAITHASATPSTSPIPDDAQATVLSTLPETVDPSVDASQPSLPIPPVPSATASVPHSNSDVGSTTIYGRVDTIVARHPANNWLADVRLACLRGPASLVPGQAIKIDQVFQTLMAMEGAIPRIGTTPSPTSSGCVTIGPASREGPPPTLRDAVNDLLSHPSIQFSDSTANLNESDVTAHDFIAQQMEFGMGTELPVGDRLLVAFDIPLGERGLGRCRWTCSPFSHGSGTVLGTMSNCWTPAGALTYPHTDDFACGMFMVHWKGRKLWLLWPGTVANLRKMEFTRTNPGDLSTTLLLIRQLEGLQLLYLTEEEFGEYAFFLRIATIHCCISITESFHAGCPVRTVDFEFLTDLKVAYDSATDWMLTRLLRRTSVCDEARKQELVLELVDSVNHWVNLGEGLEEGTPKNVLTGILDGTRASLVDIARCLNMDIEV